MAIDQRDSAPAPRIERGLLVSSPRELDAVIHRIPEGRVATIGAIRTSVARSHKAEDADPVSTRAFLRVVAQAAEEERAAGGGRIAPYWRVVNDDGSLVEEFPGAYAAQDRALTAEGVTVLHLGKVPKVTTIEHFAWQPPPLGKGVANRPPPAPRKKGAR